jgi:hypothetical protein
MGTPRIRIVAGQVSGLKVGSLLNVRYGSISDISTALIHVCFTPESGHCRATVRCPCCSKLISIR